MTPSGSADAGKTPVESMPLETQLYLSRQETLRQAKLKNQFESQAKRQRKQMRELRQELQTLEHLILTDPLRAVDALRKLLKE